MYIVIVGGGSVGYHLCRALLNEGQEALVLEKEAVKCGRFGDELGSVCMRGDGCEATTLAEAGTARADVFIATTDEDEDNLVACQLAKHKFDVPRTIARVNDPKNEKIFRKLGIDCTISVTNLILEHIEEEIPTHPLIHLLTTGEANTELVEVRIPAKSQAVGKLIRELQLPSDSLIGLVIRNGQKPRVPDRDTVIMADDRIIALITIDNEEALRKQLTSSQLDSV